MRRSFHALLVLSIASLTVGCQQAPNASSPLAPVGTLAPNNQVPARSASTGIGPFGGRTRIPPPRTGSYSVPNNYMGATAPVGQFGANATPSDSFNRAGFNRAEGVRPAGFADASPVASGPSFGAGFNNQTPGNSTAAMTPQLGGMRVHDLTVAPPPPGYRSNFNVPNQGSFQSQGGFSSQPQAQPTGQFLNGQPPITNQFQQQPNPQWNDTPARIPDFIGGAPIAGAAVNNQPSVSIARAPAASVGEVPIQPSPMQPSFRGAAQFPSTTPSTNPVNNNATGQPANLPWRRPTSAY